MAQLELDRNVSDTSERSCETKHVGCQRSLSSETVLVKAAFHGGTPWYSY